LNATSSVSSPSKCTKIVGGGFAPDPTIGAYCLQRSPDPLAGLRTATSKGKGKRREEKGGE